MDQDLSHSASVLATLLKTNRPPTEQERATILESMAPTNAKLKVVEGQISEMMAHIGALKLQVEQAEIKLQRLREEEAAILATFADHRRVFSPFRNLPDDVLREICVACVLGDFSIPTLFYSRWTPLPYTLSQISSGMRHVALTTPRIWASMRVEIRPVSPERQQIYAIIARKAIEWVERAGGLALTLIIEDCRYSMPDGSDSDPTSILFEALLSYSTRWKDIQFTSSCEVLSMPVTRLAALTANDVPLLQSVSLWFKHFIPNAVLNDSQLLRLPTIRHLTLKNFRQATEMFAVKWTFLTSITLHGDTENEIGKILQLTKCLVFCDIVVHVSNEHYSPKINLPFLKTLIVTGYTNLSSVESSGAHSILKTISAPALEIFETRIEYFDLSLLDFLKRSPHIRKLSLLSFDKDKSLTEMIEFLRHCPSLTILSLRDHYCKTIHDADQLLRAFVEEGDAGVICPRLQDASFSGYFNFSLETLRIFLEGKQEDISNTMNILPWKRVIIDINGIRSIKTRQQISELVSQKRAAGLDIHVYSW